MDTRLISRYKRPLKETVSPTGAVLYNHIFTTQCSTPTDETRRGVVPLFRFSGFGFSALKEEVQRRIYHHYEKEQHKRN